LKYELAILLEMKKKEGLEDRLLYSQIPDTPELRLPVDEVADAGNPG
jgi:hypothetical protein